MSQKKYRQAELSFRNALAIRPDSPENNLYTGKALASQGHLKKAIVFYDAAIGLDPEFEVAWYLKAEALFELGKPQAAMDYLTKALELNPNYAEAKGLLKKVEEQLKEKG